MNAAAKEAQSVQPSTSRWAVGYARRGPSFPRKAILWRRRQVKMRNGHDKDDDDNDIRAAKVHTLDSSDEGDALSVIPSLPKQASGSRKANVLDRIPRFPREKVRYLIRTLRRLEEDGVAQAGDDEQAHREAESKLVMAKVGGECTRNAFACSTDYDY